MAYVYNRGTVKEPRWYIRFRDLDGNWKWKPSGGRTKEAAKRFGAEIEERVSRGQPAIDVPPATRIMGPLLDTWKGSLRNRNAQDDKNRAALHLVPEFRSMDIGDCTTIYLMGWLDRMRAAGSLGEGSMRANLNLVSRFFSWAIERGHTTVNPVRNIPTGRRPHPAQRLDTPWLADDVTVRTLVRKLRPPIHLMFYLANRSGLRLGESAGLRMSDMAYLGDGTIRVRFSYMGPLKEDKHSEGKMKWVPAPSDAAEMLNDWLVHRRTDGAGPESLVFPNPRRKVGKIVCYSKLFVKRAWKAALASLKEETEACGQTFELDELTFYQATRHSFVSRNLSAGVSLDEVSAAVGHSSPAVTRRYYDHFIRKTFSDVMRQGLGMQPEPGAKVLTMERPKKG